MGLQKGESARLARLAMPSLHTLAAAETTFGRGYVHTRVLGRVVEHVLTHSSPPSQVTRPKPRAG